MSISAIPEAEKAPELYLATKTFNGHSKAVTSVAYFKDGKHIISGSRDKTVRVWNIENQERGGERLVHEYRFYDPDHVALSPDERKLLGGGRGVVLWDLESRQVVWSIKGREAFGECTAISPDGQLIAVTNRDEIVVLDAETGGQVREPLRFAGECQCLAFSPDGARLAVVISAVIRFSVNGVPQAGTTEAWYVQVIDVATGETIVGPFKAHGTDVVTSLVYTLDGQQLITASSDKSIRVWDATTGQEIGDPMLGHEEGIWQIALNTDGRRLASAAIEQGVRIWDLTTRREINDPLRDRDDSYYLTVGWSSDGHSIIAGDINGNIHLWNVPPLEDVTVTSTPDQAPVLATSNPPGPLLSAPRSRPSSLSSSLLELPAGAPLPVHQKSNHRPGPHDDFFGSSLDLPGLGRPPTSISSTITGTRPTSTHRTSPKGAAVEPRPSVSRFERLVGLWKQMTSIPDGWTNRISRDDCGDAHEMRPAATHPPPISTPPINVPDMQPLRKPPPTSTSRVVKVSAGYGFNRNHAATADEDDPVPCCDYLCYCMCCPCKRSLQPDSDLESDTES